MGFLCFLCFINIGLNFRSVLFEKKIFERKRTRVLIKFNVHVTAHPCEMVTLELMGEYLYDLFQSKC